MSKLTALERKVIGAIDDQLKVMFNINGDEGNKYIPEPSHTTIPPNFAD